MVTTVLKYATTKVLTCTKDTDHLTFFIDKLGAIDKNECSYTTDAITMFLNIDTEEGLADLLISYETKLVKHTKNLPIKSNESFAPVNETQCLPIRCNILPTKGWNSNRSTTSNRLGHP